MSIRRGSCSMEPIDTIDIIDFLRHGTPPMETPRRNLMVSDIVEATRLAARRKFRGAISSASIPKRHKHRLFLSKKRDLSVVVAFDRQQLSTLLDVRSTFFENILVVLLSMLVAVLGFALLLREIYHDFLMFVVCFVVAGCQYSLVKSVQPDSASPMHGYNRVIVYSRALYFCIFAGVLLILDNHLPCTSEYSYKFELYSVNFNLCWCMETVHFLLQCFIPLFPVIFLLGLLPQCTTFLLYSLEQLDVQVFGGTAKTNLIGAAISTFFSIFTVGWMSCLAVWAIDNVNNDHHFLFSIYCSLLLPVSYLLSRLTSEPKNVLDAIKQTFDRKPHTGSISGSKSLTDNQDLPENLKQLTKSRLESNVFICPLLFVFVFALHISTIFSAPIMNGLVIKILCLVAGLVGFITNYMLPKMRKRLPWLCFEKSCLPLSAELNNYSDYSLQQAKVLFHEHLHICLQIVEKYLLNTSIIIAISTADLPALAEKYNIWVACVIGTICSLKLMRYNLCNLTRMYQVILCGVVLFGHDLDKYNEFALLDFYLSTLIIPKMVEMMKKLQFVFTYIAPWQIPWGSTFHAFAQPVSVPHSALLFTQTFISSLVGAPLSPFMGSAMFLMSYPRPVKFWEKDYKTKRQDVTSRRLAHHLDPSPVGDDDDNLNSIFYEHLARSLQVFLSGDIALGRWGNVEQGDFFLMASESLNCLVHIVETGNGFVTFQVRGLEFRGTYCHQREADAINEDPTKNRGCCCCSTRKFPGLLSLNEAFSQRWLAWEIITNSYTIDGYNLTQLNAQQNFAFYEHKRSHLKLYVESLIFYLMRSPKLESWLKNETVISALVKNGYGAKNSQPELDPTFDKDHHVDYDQSVNGVTREKFCQCFFDWVVLCANKNNIHEVGIESDLVTLCFGLAVFARRALGTASHNLPDSYLFGVHALFKGDFRITSFKDEWVFVDMDLVQNVVAPAIRMSLRLHLDSFISQDVVSPLDRLYCLISDYETVGVFVHESDPKWRSAVLANTEKLLTLRHVLNESCDSYKIITLDKKFLRFKIVKLNQECVRGLWAGQQQELIFLRNSNSERGSIQNARQALRNIINSSCDQPIGYPIYVSPLITSFIDSNPSLPTPIACNINFSSVLQSVSNAWHGFVQRCLDGCTSGRYSGGCGPPTGAAGASGGFSLHQVNTGADNSVTRLSTGSCATLPKPFATSRGSLFGSGKDSQMLDEDVNVESTL